MEQENTNLDIGTNHNKILLEWNAPEFIPTPRTKKWYFIAGFIVFLIIGYAFVTQSITMAIVFVLLAGVFIMTHKRSPRIIKVKISQLGLEYDKKFYHYNAINAFWIVYHPPFVRCIYIRLGGNQFRYIKIELNDQNPNELRNLLIKEIPEIEGAGERVFDILTRVLRLQ